MKDIKFSFLGFFIRYDIIINISDYKYEWIRRLLRARAL